MKAIAWFLLITFLPSCVTHKVKEHYLPLKNTIPCTKQSKNVYVFFEGEEHPAEFRHVGYVNVKGHRFATEEEVMMRFQRLAQANCANGIINARVIKDGYDDFITYEAEGKSVWFDETKDMQEQYKAYRVAGFERQVKKYKRSENTKEVLHFFGNMIFYSVAISAVVLIALLDLEDDEDDD
jgi:hypothetical protein